MHNLKDIRKDFTLFKKKIEERNVKVNFDNINKLDKKNRELIIVHNQSYKDKRGYFKESWNQKKFNEIIGSNEVFVQDNHSLSYKGVLRGLHYQRAPMEQGKLLRCIKGKIFDVLVDIRKDSQTNMKWIGLELDSNNHEMEQHFLSSYSQFLCLNHER